MLKKIFKFLSSPFLGKKAFQGIFGFLYWVSLKGMNIGGGSTFSDSGEAWVLEFLAKNKKAFVLFDVGANKGNYALMAEGIFRKNCITQNIFCFEPSKSTFAMLEKNISGHSGINSFNFGMGDKSAELVLHSEGEGSGLASLYDRDLGEQGKKLSNTESVSISTVDEFCLKQNINNIDLLKIDVEGHELSVIKGSGSIIAKGMIKAIQFEFGGTALDARIYLKDFFLLLSGKYKIYRILKNGLQEIPVYHETCEIFTTTNYLAILK